MMVPIAEARVRLDWGRDGVRRAVGRGEAVVIVDVLRFSTTVATAVDRGAIIIPCGFDEVGELQAAYPDALVGRKNLGAERGGLSLSPVDMQRDLVAGTTVILPSPNGSTCCRIAAGASNTGRPVWIGGLVNATAIGVAAAGWLAADPGHAITVVACGERHRQADLPAGSERDENLRVAIEDLLGAGRILAAIHDRQPALPIEPEAELAILQATQPPERIASWIAGSPSGLELLARGHADDLAFATTIDSLHAVPALHLGQIRAATPAA